MFVSFIFNSLKTVTDHHEQAILESGACPARRILPLNPEETAGAEHQYRTSQYYVSSFFTVSSYSLNKVAI